MLRNVCVCDFSRFLQACPKSRTLTVSLSLHHCIIAPFFSVTAGRSTSAGPTAPRHNNHHDCGWPGAFKPMDTVVSLPKCMGIRVKAQDLNQAL